MLNGHGDDIYSHSNTIASNFSSNVYNKFDSSGLEKYICSHISSIHSYPEPDAFTLKSIISTKQNISIDEVCITNGATEAIYLIAQLFRGAKTAIVTPTFSEYEDACRKHEHQLYFIESLDDIDSDTQLVWFCNPNNPTGRIYDTYYLNEVIANQQHTYFVIDQSYADFTDQQTWSAKDALQYSNVMVLHSLTKCYAIPGLRLGYITATAEQIEKIMYFLMPWSVNQIAQIAGQYLLQNVEYDFNECLAESIEIQKAIAEIKGIEVLPSAMHYFLCRLEEGKASDLKQFLIDKYGILIRDASNFRGLNNSYFRIAIQSHEENQQLIKALKEWMKLRF